MTRHFLYPSTMFASAQPAEVTTILGSCVAVCLWDRYLGIGGINHYMLPTWNGMELASPKYGNIAIERLTEKMLQLGCKKNNLVAKVFGGGEVITVTSSSMHIGERNIMVAEEMLQEQNIPIIGRSTGGKNGRKIIFNTHTGEVLQCYIKNSIGK
ncbi:MAG: chemotaxis protein CheD [Bacteroidales bacterium]|nr:chemotaxis protein CheD [Bacteroidales bacterium]MBQ5551792.1 chemotaxis protein CheD [Bacteroidales bacterium]MBQ5574940.1 chemotaxis protein CheD [Bacteroidales bacterium]MBR2104911.1 chemotaxis protein CheD [Bacteroidales bacterium]MBR2199505.1 chemotaxis protein CheD [Bacteroidales bacterium]